MTPPNTDILKNILGIGLLCVDRPLRPVSLQQHNRVKLNKLCAWRRICPRPSPLPVGTQVPRALLSRRNVAVLSHAESVPTLTAAAALRVKAALSDLEILNLLTLKVVTESRVTCQFWS